MTRHLPAGAWLEAVLPFLPALRRYTSRDLRADLISAACVTPIAVPQAMAYALIAGVHPKYGLYASILPVIIAALWGSSRFLVAGPTNAISVILSSTLAHLSVGGAQLASLPPDERMAYVFGIAVLTGSIQIAMGLARLGDLANFISHSVMVGFAGGAALLIAAGQLKTLLGLDISGSAGFFQAIGDALRHLHQINFWSLGVAAGSVIAILLTRRLFPRLPASLLALALISAGVWLTGAEARGVRLVGAIPQDLPPLSLPPAPNLTAIRDLFLPSLAIALLGAVESLAIGKNLAAVRGESFDGSRELVGQGLGNVAAGFSSGIPGCGSFTRSALNVTSGGRTRFASMFSGLLAIPMLLLMAPLAAYIPLPALSATLLVIAWGMIDRRAVRLCLTATRMDRSVLLTTFGAALLLDLEQAIFLGVLLSLTLFLYKEAHPRVQRLDRRGKDNAMLAPYPWARRCPRLSVYLIEGTLFFGAISELERQLREEERTPAGAVVLHLARVFWIDASGAHALDQFAERCHARGVPLVLVLNDTVRAILTRTGVLEHLGEGFAVDTLEQGLRSAHRLLHSMASGRCKDEARLCGVSPSSWPGDPLPPGEGYGVRDLSAPER